MLLGRRRRLNVVCGGRGGVRGRVGRRQEDNRALNDRYRGIHNGRRVVLVNPADLDELGLADRQLVDLVSIWEDGVTRRANGFRVIAYPAARGSAASYYPETNVLVPLDSVAEISNTPTSKGVYVRLEPRVGSVPR